MFFPMEHNRHKLRQTIYELQLQFFSNQNNEAAHVEKTTYHVPCLIKRKNSTVRLN